MKFLPLSRRNPEKISFNMTSKKHPFGEQPKLKATQPWNQAPKKKSNGWKMIPFGSKFGPIFSEKHAVSFRDFLSTCLTFRCFFLHEWFMETFLEQPKLKKPQGGKKNHHQNIQVETLTRNIELWRFLQPKKRLTSTPQKHQRTTHPKRGPHHLYLPHYLLVSNLHVPERHMSTTQILTEAGLFAYKYLGSLGGCHVGKLYSKCSKHNCPIECLSIESFLTFSNVFSCSFHT